MPRRRVALGRREFASEKGFHGPYDEPYAYRSRYRHADDGLQLAEIEMGGGMRFGFNQVLDCRFHTFPLLLVVPGHFREYMSSGNV
jgi:hypothetical protein